MVRVLIPSYSQNKSRNGQPFTVYNVDVYCNGRSHSLERRYRHFHELHCDLKKSRQLLPEFPPKKIRNLSAKVVEERRHLLEVYLQAVVSLPLLPRQLVQFLELPEQSSRLISADSCLTDSDCEEELSHQPVIGFAPESVRYPLSGGTNNSNDATANESAAGSGRCVKQSSTSGGESGSPFSSLSDIVLTGSLSAFYAENEEDSNNMCECI